MDPHTFLIPKQTDANLVTALGLIRDQLELKGLSNLVIRVTPHYGTNYIDIAEKEPAKAEPIAYVISEQSEIMPTLQIVHGMQGSPRTALNITRRTERITDEVAINWQNWAVLLPEQMRAGIYVKMMALARKHLRAFDVEANLSGTADNEWARYRDSQVAILNSLQETTKTVLVEVSRRGLEAENEARTKSDKLQEELRSETKATQDRLTEEHAQKLKELEDKAAALKKREDSFNIKDARYVARQEQQRQLEQIQDWLEGWSLTKGTTEKRFSVTTTYIGAIILTAAVTVLFSIQTVDVLQGKDFSQVAWWQWMLLSLKSALPLAACTTFLIYLIRWNSAWARQHAEEEFRNRARILDIGRSTWLLEAVRDAQDHQKEFPPDLLKELSKNLFNQSVISDGAELYPEAVGDILLQGLSSLKVKSRDGTEVEATRGKK